MSARVWTKVGAGLRMLLAKCQACPASERLDTVHGVVGGAAELPCNTSAASPENYPMLVMWFKDNNLNPFYRWIESLFILQY